VVRKVLDLDLDFDVVYMLNIPATIFLKIINKKLASAGFYSYI
jgi:hypothetical protein